MITRRQWLGCLLGSGLYMPAMGAVGAEPLPATCEVLVVGSGLAGLSAAYAARQAGKCVCLIEKGPLIGGHSLLSSGSIAAVSPARQGQYKVRDSVEQFVEDAWEIGGQVGNRAILTRIAEGSEEALAILEREDIQFGPPFQATAGVHPRAFAATSQGSAAGRTYVTAMLAAVVRLGTPIFLRTKALKLMPKPHALAVEVEEPFGRSQVTADQVILATGGFTANPTLRQKIDGRLTPELKTSANPYGLLWDGADGDGLCMAQGIGAACTQGMGCQLLPIGGGRILDYAGGDIYVDDDGKRFVNEAATRNKLASVIMNLPEKGFWVITDSQSRKGATLGTKLINGIVRKSDSVREMARGMGINAEVLQHTLDEYNRGVRDGVDRQFGKTVFTQTIDKPPFYWGREGIYVHTSLDGLMTDDQARVLNNAGNPIPHLFAAGEVVGGIFGRDRLGGAMLTNCLVMGRVAGLGTTTNPYPKS